MNEAQMLEHLPMVRHIAARYKMFAPASVDYEDLVQWGVIGLMKAAGSYSGNKGATFSSYAYIKIRGAILDNLKQFYNVSPYYRKEAKKISEAVAELREALDREPREEEIAEHMGFSISQYRALLRKSAAPAVFSMEALAEEGREFASPGEHGDNGDIKATLEWAIEKLPEREKLILSLYYKEELTLKEIGEVLELTEARISQLHNQAIVRLRSFFKQSTTPLPRE